MNLDKTILNKIFPLIGILILAFLFYTIGIENLINSIRGTNTIFIFLAIPVYILGLLLQTEKWHYLMKTQKINVSRLKTLRAYTVGLVYGFITPGKVGSLIRVSYLKEDSGKSFTTCLTNTILDRFLDLFAVFALAVVGSFFFAYSFSGLLPVMLLTLLGLIFLITLATSKSFLTKILSFVHKTLIPKKYKEKAADSFREFITTLPSKKQLVFAYLFTLFNWVVIYSSVFLLSKAFWINIPYPYLITMVPIGTIIGLIPITISGLGTREATIVILFSQFGVAAAAATTLSLFSFLLNTVVILLVMGLTNLFLKLHLNHGNY